MVWNESTYGLREFNHRWWGCFLNPVKLVGVVVLGNCWHRFVLKMQINKLKMKTLFSWNWNRVLIHCEQFGWCLILVWCIKGVFLLPFWSKSHVLNWAMHKEKAAGTKTLLLENPSPQPPKCSSGSWAVQCTRGQCLLALWMLVVGTQGSGSAWVSDLPLNPSGIR